MQNVNCQASMFSLILSDLSQLSLVICFMSLEPVNYEVPEIEKLNRSMPAR